MSYADDQICFRDDVAARLLVDITVCKENTSLLNETVKLQETKIDGLEKDKVILKQEREQYKQLYTKENASRQEAEASKPSRLTWFSIGSIATGVATLLGIFLIK